MVYLFDLISRYSLQQSGPIVEVGEQRSPIDYNILYTSA